MKKLRILSIILFAALSVFVACKADTLKDMASTTETASNESGTSGLTYTFNGARIASSQVCNAYIISLESINSIGGRWEWIWSVQNPNPGNGNGGTIQNLSHWGMYLGTCVTLSSVVSAAYSADGITWTTFTPVVQVDPSQTCMALPTLKFNYGTVGSTPSYYKLVVNQNYSSGWVPGYYKSGAVTGCCIFNFPGIGCPSGTDERK